MDAVETSVRLPLDPKPGPHRDFLQSLVAVLDSFLLRVSVRLNQCLPKDGSENVTGDVTCDAGLTVGTTLFLGTYTVGTRPAVADGAIIHVSDGAPGANFQGRQGAAWVNLG